MLNNKVSKCSPVNIANISIRYDVDSYGSHRSAAVTSERFLCSACLLPYGEFLGWQIDTRSLSNAAFSSLGVKATMEDLDWIFHQCADNSPLTSGWMEDLYTEERKVYMLTATTDGTEDVDIPEQMKFNLSDCDMLKMMAEMGAVIRVIAGGAAKKAKGHGMIFISLPDEMTLRMRCMLSLAFPHMAADEVGRPYDEANELNYLSDDCFLEGMVRILSALMCRKDDREHTERIDRDDVIRSEAGTTPRNGLESDTDEKGDGGSVDIGGLGLSIRSYNCLKRAGIDTVEELRELSDDDLMYVRNLGRKSMEEIRRKIAEIRDLAEPAPVHETNYAASLDELIGLTGVKEQIGKIAAFAKMKQDMSKDSNVNIPIALNMGFVGNPGTAKTTVARIAAGIFYEIGLLPYNELVETGRTDLVGKYVGHTAAKVKDAFRRAKGRVLFIDEAYSLVDGREGSFGDEAINTIVQEMENNREKTIVIFAGYPDEMERFFLRNHGLKSRVPFIINFSDYSAEEMVMIAESEAKKRGFSVGAEAYGKLAAICSAAASRPDMGNGRFCRNLIENAIISYASRIYGDDSNGAVKDYILAAKDFTYPTDMDDTKKIPMGFHV